MVLSVDNGTTQTILKYYYAGSQRIAMRTNGTLNFLLGDHLGSTSLVTDATGVVISEMKYKAWGEVRYASGTSPTDYTYTGQFSYAADFGLMFYNARWYDSSLSRFAQADTVIPGGVQGYDRYAYTNNNPIIYTDPSGHCTLGGYWQSDDSAACTWSNSNNLDFTGYSNSEKQELQNLYNNGGSNAQHGIEYMLSQGIHVTVGTGWQSWGGSRGAWFDEGNNTLTINSESPGNFTSGSQPGLSTLSPWGLSLIIHEARHLEQGSDFSHSKLGEMDAWQVQFDVLKHLGQKLSPAQTDILNAEALDDITVNGTTQKGYKTLIQENYPSYWKSNGFGLYTYPDYPNVCLSLVGCGPEIPWWLRLNTR